MKKILLAIIVFLLASLAWCQFNKTSFELYSVTFQKRVSDGSFSKEVAITKQSDIDRIEEILNSIDWDQTTQVKMAGEPRFLLTVECTSTHERKKHIETLSIWHTGVMNEESDYGRLSYKKAFELEKILKSN